MSDNFRFSCDYTISGGDREKDPPVLIPNTEVKLLIVENTWLATVREDRTLPDNKKTHPQGCAFFSGSVVRLLTHCTIEIVPIFPAGKISSMRKTGVFLMNTAR